MGTAHILEALRISSPNTSVIVASSDKAYGKSKDKSYTEESPLSGDHHMMYRNPVQTLSLRRMQKRTVCRCSYKIWKCIWRRGCTSESDSPGICMAIIDKKS